MLIVVYLCIMGTHGSIASERASRVAVAGVWKRVIFDFIVPWLYQLKNGSIAVNRRQTWSVSYTVHIVTNAGWPCRQTEVQTLSLSDFREEVWEVVVHFGRRCIQGLGNTETFKTLTWICDFEKQKHLKMYVWAIKDWEILRNVGCYGG